MAGYNTVTALQRGHFFLLLILLSTLFQFSKDARKCQREKTELLLSITLTFLLQNHIKRKMSLFIRE